VKILFLTAYGETSDIARRLKNEGNQVRLWIKDPGYRKDIYEGLIDKIQVWQMSVDWADLIIFDSNSMDDIWKQVHKKKPCYGGSEFGAILEKDREYAHKVMEKIGLNRIESKTFDKIEEVTKHLKEHKVPHVIKPFGDKIASEHLIIGKYPDNSDAIALVERFKEMKVPYDGIEVEEKKDGIEVGISAWFNGKDFIYPINVNFEHKPFASSLDGHGLGFLTGETGTVLKYDLNSDNKIFKETLFKMKGLLAANNYRGQIDISLIVDDGGKPWPLEFTPRFGIPSAYIECELQKDDLGKLFSGVANGTLKENNVSYDWAMGVVVMSPGFPSSSEVKKQSLHTPIFGINKENAFHVHLYEAMKKENKLVTTNGIGYPLVVSSSGETIEECQDSVYRMLDKDGIYVPRSWYRVDIGQRVLQQMGDIKGFGILPPYPSHDPILVSV